MTDQDRRVALERADSRGPSALRALGVVAAVLMLVAGGAILARPDSTVHRADQRAQLQPSAAATDSDAADATAEAFAYQSVRVVAPETNSRQRNDGSIRLAVRGGLPYRFVRASVLAYGTELGVSTVHTDVRGVIEARVGLFPVSTPVDARLMLHEAFSGFVLADVPFTLLPGASVSLFAPTSNTHVEPGDRLWIFGSALPSVTSVHARLRRSDGTVIAERDVAATASGTAWRSFATELQLPRLPARSQISLEISWRDAQNGRQSARVPITLAARP